MGMSTVEQDLEIQEPDALVAGSSVPGTKDAEDRADLRKKNRENKQLRERLRAAEAELESARAAKKNEEEEAAKRKGEFQKLYETERQEKERIARELQQERITRVVGGALSKAGVRVAAVSDVLAILPQDKLKIVDGVVEGVDELVEKFKAEKPWFFEEPPATPKYTLTPEDIEAAKHIDWNDPWGAASTSGQGLDGYRPASRGNASSLRMTPDFIEDARRRGLAPKDWFEIEKARLARKQKRSK